MGVKRKDVALTRTYCNLLEGFSFVVNNDGVVGPDAVQLWVIFNDMAHTDWENYLPSGEYEVIIGRVTYCNFYRLLGINSVFVYLINQTRFLFTIDFNKASSSS